MREFEVDKKMIEGNYNKCMVCLKNLVINEKIVLCSIQRVKEGFGNVVSIPIHTKCYWVKK